MPATGGEGAEATLLNAEIAEIAESLSGLIENSAISAISAFDRLPDRLLNGRFRDVVLGLVSGTT